MAMLAIPVVPTYAAGEEYTVTYRYDGDIDINSYGTEVGVVDNDGHNLQPYGIQSR